MKVEHAIRARERLLIHRKRWEQKPFLREVYNKQFYAPMIKLAVELPKPWIEIGAGPGLMQPTLSEKWATDIITMPWLAASLDAIHLPFKNQSVGALLLLDVLHHLENPFEFLKEAQRVLLPGGRIILVEPWLTPFSRLIYRYFHEEDCDETVDPFIIKPSPANKKEAFDGNQALPYLLFSATRISKTLNALPKLKLVQLKPFAHITYLCSFGFQPLNLFPSFLYPVFFGLETLLNPFLVKSAAMKTVIVLEKSGSS